ncbi:hypothetical protein CJ030_MR1G022260 [Morella rubra]|uniref:F-box domain-containing protein n=1 Tax=Morella rubra TaxID=262757 RepID=A0A6A1WT27_9ROSI|nr:hypothetical protein CJ030_MR1G022260 [Morella rubra]
MEWPFLNDDVRINILSRLSVKDLCASKCVSKRWNALISSASFLRAHYQRSLGTLSGLLFQQYDRYDYADYIDNNVVYISVGEEKLRRDEKLLRFLPVKEEEPEEVEESEEEEEFEKEEEPEEEEESEKEEELSGDEKLLDFLPEKEEKVWSVETLLDFLPEKVVLMSSCDGLLCCRNCIYEDDCIPSNIFESRTRLEKMLTEKLVIYVCNPSTKEWIAVRSTGSCSVSDNIGLAFYPFSCSSMAAPVFKLVSIKSSHTIAATYSFSLYTSRTRTWAESKELCHCKYRVLDNNKIFVGMTFHWLTDSHHIVAFDVERELSSVIKLLGSETQPCLVCLGSSEGDLYYVASNDSEVSVWMLRDYFKSEWVLKHRLTKLDLWRKPLGKLDSSWTTRFTQEYLGTVTLREDKHECHFQLPLAFYEHVLYLHVDGWLFSFNFRTWTLKSHRKYHFFFSFGAFPIFRVNCDPILCLLDTYEVS